MKNIILNIMDKYLEIFPEEEKRQEQFIKYVENHNKDEVIDWNNFEGHIVTGGIIYSKQEKKFLVVYHKDLQMYVYPGGHVDSNDINPLTAASREVIEETGLKKIEQLKITEDQLIPFDIDTHIVKRNERLNLPKHYHFDFRYLFTINEIEEINIDKNELENYKWVELSEIYDNLNESIIAKKLEKILK